MKTDLRKRIYRTFWAEYHYRNFLKRMGEIAWERYVFDENHEQIVAEREAAAKAEPKEARLARCRDYYNRLLE